MFSAVNPMSYGDIEVLYRRLLLWPQQLNDCDLQLESTLQAYNRRNDNKIDAQRTTTQTISLVVIMMMIDERLLQSASSQQTADGYSTEQYHQSFDERPLLTQIAVIFCLVIVPIIIFCITIAWLCETRGDDWYESEEVLQRYHKHTDRVILRLQQPCVSQAPSDVHDTAFPNDKSVLQVWWTYIHIYGMSSKTPIQQGLDGIDDIIWKREPTCNTN